MGSLIQFSLPYPRIQMMFLATRSRSRSLSALFAFAAVSASSAFGQATIQVPFQAPTIQAGIDLASNGDTVLVAPGTYFEQVDFKGKAISVLSSGGAATTLIDSQGAESPSSPFAAVVAFSHGETSTSILQGFTITGADNAFDAFSCGIYSVGSSPSVTDCIITKNMGQVAGGIWGDGTFTQCEISNNTGRGALSDGTFIDSVIKGNFSEYGEGAGLNGAPDLFGCLVEGNKCGTSGGGGGGLFVSQGTSIVDGCVFIANETGFEGYRGGAINGPAVISNSLFVGNKAHTNGMYSSLGGAIHNAVSVTTSTIVGNKVEGTCPVFLSCAGGGVSSTPVTSSIVRGNFPDQVSSSPTAWSNVEGGALGTGNIDLDPKFLDAASGDYRLRTDSPSIDAGDPLATPDPDGTRLDQGAFPFEALLFSTVDSISLSAGGTQPFELHADPHFPNATYILMGTASGTTPGLQLGAFNLPINPDFVTLFSLTHANSAVYPGSFGLTDGLGLGSAALVAAPGTSPSLAGLTLHHAYVRLDSSLQVDFASNAVPVQLVP